MIDLMSVVNLSAILVGPIAAVVITRLMDNRTATQLRRYQVFRDLMRTRAAKISPPHVDALNLVEIEFHQFKSVKDAWHRYMENLGTSVPADTSEQNNFFVRREQLFIKLIQEIATTIGLKSVDITDVMTTNYYPVGWQNEQEEQQQARQLLIQVLSGNKPLTVRVFDPGSWSGPYPPAVPAKKASTTVADTEKGPGHHSS